MDTITLPGNIFVGVLFVVFLLGSVATFLLINAVERYIRKDRGHDET